MRTAPARVSAAFPPEPVSGRGARRLLHSFLVAHARDDLMDAAELALSEVVTNAVLHAHTPFEVTAALADDGSLRVEVADGNPLLPLQRDYAEQATTGRGMRLVSAVTADCGVRADGAAGKTVWFVVRADREVDEEALLASWDADVADARPADADIEVVLLDLPPALWLAAREHHDAILRELALYAQEHPGQAPPAERFAQADRARGVVSARVVAALDVPAGAPTPQPSTLPPIDLRVPLARDAITAYAALQDVLDVAERLARAGQLLARPGLPEIVAVRDWVCEQVMAQAAGVPPSPWPGLERFAVAGEGESGRPTPAWDTSTVTGADRGVVAADEANRIIAVSRPLAAALGWDVDDLVGRRVVALVPPELREAHVVGFTRHLTTGQTRVTGMPLRLPVLRADGSRVECDLLIEQTTSTPGRRVYVAWIDPVT